MNDMTPAIQPKSDQLNADDMMAGPITVTIRDVKITPGSEQPVSILVEGTDKAYRPCKSMSRVLVAAWGADAKAYIGRSLTLYRDPTVKWGGMEVGGIRISHMSDIDGAKQMMLTATKGSRKPHKVLPLVMQATTPTPTQGDPAEKWASAYTARLDTFATVAALQEFAGQKATKLAELETSRPDLHQKVVDALAQRSANLSAAGSSFDDDDLIDPALSTAANQPETILDALDSQTAKSKANEIVGEITAAISIMDVNSIESRSRPDMEAMPADLADYVQSAINTRKREIKAGHEKAKAAEKAPAE